MTRLGKSTPNCNGLADQVINRTEHLGLARLSRYRVCFETDVSDMTLSGVDRKRAIVYAAPFVIERRGGTLNDDIEPAACKEAYIVRRVQKDKVICVCFDG